MSEELERLAIAHAKKYDTPTECDPRRRFTQAQMEIALRRLATDMAKRYQEALEPFAECCDQISDTEDDEEWAKFRLLVKDYRRARQALAENP